MKKLFFISAIVFLASCTDPSGAKRVLEDAGYKDVTTGGYGWFNGDKNDSYKTNFKATSPSGKKVTGCVTRGMFFKGYTIRLN